MKLVSMLGLILLLAASLQPNQRVQSSGPEPQQVREAWVARYTGPGRSWPYAIAVDAYGSVYVTGGSEVNGGDFDYATVKYDSHGNELWVARYNGPANGLDGARALAVDSQGNVYVTGSSEGQGTLVDYATVKYDRHGNQLWVARFNGPLDMGDPPSALGVDSLGNIYVTGFTYRVGTGFDYATVKYDGQGNEDWVVFYDGPNGGDDFPSKLTVDAQGNIYVTGTSWDPGSGGNFATVKYDAQGDQLWAARYTSPGSLTDEPSDLVVDGEGNVYVVGESEEFGVGNPFHYTTVAYDSQGDQLWAAHYDGPGNWDSATAVAVDGQGSVYVTGSSVGVDTSWDYATVKYDGQGNQVWVARYDGPDNQSDGASDLALDTLGGVYVTGVSSGIGSEYDYATMKYDSQGNQLWVMRYNGPTNNDDFAQALAVTPWGSVHVTGSNGFAVPIAYATVKYVEEVPRGALASLGQRLDEDGCAGCTSAILQVQDPEMGVVLPIPVRSYAATIAYVGPMEVLECRLKPPFDTGACNIDNVAGTTSFSGLAPAGAIPPIDPLAFLTLRMTGTVLEQVQATLTFSEITDVDGNPIAQVVPPPQRTFQRGDATGEGAITLSDVLKIAQYIVGLLDCTEINCVNAASIKHDGGCDKITGADLLVLAQYVVGLRGPGLTPLDVATPPQR